MKLSDLTLIQILGIILIINGALSGAVNELTDLLGPTMAKHVLSITVIGSGICGGFITMFGGLGSQVKNVLAMPGVEKIAVNGQAGGTLAAIAVDPMQDKIAPTPASMDKVVATAAKAIVILAVLAAGLFAFAGDASAQIRLKPLSLGAAATPVPAAKPAATDPLAKFMDDLAKIQQDVVTGVIADITAADADAGSLLNTSDPLSFKDPIAHACYPAEIKFLQSLPVATPPTGKFILVQLFQKKRDFVAQIKAGLPDYLKLGCAALLGDEVQILTKSLGLIGVSVAANALLPGAGFALPTL